MKHEEAVNTGLRVLGWIAGNSELLPVFLGASGASLVDMKAQAETPEFLASVLDFLLMDDTWVVGFADAEGLPYDAPMRARQALPGGTQVHWT